MDYPERERQFDAVEAPEHRLHTIENGLFLIANNPAVRAALAEQEPIRNNVIRPDFKTPRIVVGSEKEDMANDARQQIEDIAA
jgi:hypothetical protein